MWLPIIPNMSFFEGWSVLISRRIGSGCAFLLSKKTPNCVPCQGSRTSPSCCSYRCQQLLGALIGECRSCLSVNDCDDHDGREPPNACYYCRRYFYCKCCSCCYYCCFQCCCPYCWSEAQDVSKIATKQGFIHCNCNCGSWTADKYFVLGGRLASRAVYEVRFSPIFTIQQKEPSACSSSVASRWTRS
jgi:hypothetical protein